MDDKIKVLVESITGQAYKLSAVGIDAFINYSPHVQLLEVYVYLNGWSRGSNVDKHYNVYLNRPKAHDKLIEILEELSNL